MIDVLYEGGNSADVVKSFFELHIEPVELVLDMTYGQGTFWQWDWQTRFNLHAIDLYTLAGPNQKDFRDTGLPSAIYDCVVFDPPFTANGPSAGHNARYGADRSIEGAPQKWDDVKNNILAGLVEADRITKKFILVKCQDVIESGKLWPAEYWIQRSFSMMDYTIIDWRLQLGPRMPQPDQSRDSEQRHFRNRPAKWMLAGK
jgi:hypothetical protein